MDLKGDRFSELKIRINIFSKINLYAFVNVQFREAVESPPPSPTMQQLSGGSPRAPGSGKRSPANPSTPSSAHKVFGGGPCCCSVDEFIAASFALFFDRVC